MTAAAFIARVQEITGAEIGNQRQLTELFDQLKEEWAHELAQWIDSKNEPTSLSKARPPRQSKGPS